MTMYRVYLKDSDWLDWGSCHFNVFAESRHEAWKKACELEPAENLEGIEVVKHIPSRA